MANPKFRRLAMSEVGSEAWHAYEECKQAYKAYSALKRRAEEMAVKVLPSLPQGMAYVFTYNYGHWSVFIGEPSQTKPAASTPKVSLSDWIAQQANGGYQS